MLAPDRRRRVLELVRANGSAQVEQLAAELAVSRSTIRRDLGDLEADGLLRRARGGAYVHRAGEVRAPAQPATSAVKERIGRAAAARLSDGMTIMLLAGSTTLAMVPFLAGRSITVVTNGLDIGHALAAYPQVSLVMLGGVLHRDQMTLLGPLSEQNMANLHVDVMFGGAHGVHPDTGVTSAKISQAGDHSHMLRHAESLVIMADASKIGRRGPTVLARIDQVGLIITDDGAPADVTDALRAAGAQVDIC